MVGSIFPASMEIFGFIHAVRKQCCPAHWVHGQCLWLANPAAEPGPGIADIDPDILKRWVIRAAF